MNLNSINSASKGTFTCAYLQIMNISQNLEKSYLPSFKSINKFLTQHIAGVIKA